MSTERMRKFREKLKLNENRNILETYQEKNRQHQKKFKLKDIEAYKARRNIQQNDRRTKEAITKWKDNNRGYLSKKGLNLAVKKASQALSLETGKAKEVVTKLAENLGLEIKGKEKATKVICRQRKNFIDTPKLVEEFYNSDQITRQMPGKKDNIKIIIDGQKQLVQKRLMLMTVHDAHDLFLQQYPNYEISLSKFYSLRPKNLILVADISHSICCCSYCENFSLLFDALLPFLSDEIQSVKEMLVKLMCYRYNYACASSSCIECCNIESKFLSFFKPDTNFNDTIEIVQWEMNSKFMQQCVKQRAIDDVINMIMVSYPNFKIHKYLIKTQFEYIDNLKKTQDENHVVLSMDYSQNFTTTSQNQIQQAYFSSRQISLFTAVAYVGQKDPISFAIVSDDVTQSKYFVYYYLKLIIENLKHNFPDISHLEIVTDGCASQFKSKFSLSNLLFFHNDFGLTANWNFWPTSHGKTSADGIGGFLKQRVHQRIMSGQYRINNADDFAKCANDICNKTRIIHVLPSDVEEIKMVLDERWKKVKAINNVRKHHFFSVNSENAILQCISSKKDDPKVCRVF